MQNAAKPVGNIAHWQIPNQYKPMLNPKRGCGSHRLPFQIKKKRWLWPESIPWRCSGSLPTSSSDPKKRFWRCNWWLTVLGYVFLCTHDDISWQQFSPTPKLHILPPPHPIHPIPLNKLVQSSGSSSGFSGANVMSPWSCVGSGWWRPPRMWLVELVERLVRSCQEDSHSQHLSTSLNLETIHAFLMSCENLREACNKLIRLQDPKLCSKIRNWTNSQNWNRFVRIILNHLKSMSIHSKS